MDFLTPFPTAVRIMLIVVIAAGVHYTVQLARRTSHRLLGVKAGSERGPGGGLARRWPKTATLGTILMSAFTFALYFASVGLILHEFKISLTAYFASATVIGLAVGFGLQGFVQDVVIGLTLIFSDALNIGDMVELSGQTGTVDLIGLRFTSLVNLYGQKVLIPNRNIATISRFRGGCIRAYVDVQVPEAVARPVVEEIVTTIGTGMHRQHAAIILEPPELFDRLPPAQGPWHYVRIKFKLWPGQAAIIEGPYKQRVLARMKTLAADYADWMIAVTYKVE